MQDDFRPRPPSPQPQPGQPGNVESWQPNRPDVVSSSTGRTITPPAEPMTRPTIIMPTRDTQPTAQPQSDVVSPTNAEVSPVEPAAPGSTPPAPVSPEAPQPAQPEPLQSQPTHPAAQPMTAEPTTDAPEPQPAQPTVPPDTPPQKKGVPHALKAFGVGLILFIVFGFLFSSSLLPGKPWLNAPLNSSTVDVGGSLKVCSGTVTGNTISHATTQKRGFPLAYSYKQVDTTTWNCDGKQQFAGQDTSSDFNPLAALVDFACVMAATIVGVLIFRFFLRKKT